MNQAFPTGPQNKTFPTPLSYSAQLKGRMLLLKTPHTLASKDREINFKPRWNLPHC